MQSPSSTQDVVTNTRITTRITSVTVNYAYYAYYAYYGDTLLGITGLQGYGDTLLNPQ